MGGLTIKLPQLDIWAQMGSFWVLPRVQKLFWARNGLILGSFGSTQVVEQLFFFSYFNSDLILA